MPNTISARSTAHHTKGDRSAKKSVIFCENLRHQLNGISGLSYMHTPSPLFGADRGPATDSRTPRPLDSPPRFAGRRVLR